MLTPGVAPPADYYRNNLARCFRFIASRSSAMEYPPAAELVEAWSQRSVAAQRLYARLLSRSQVIIRVDSLHYAEVGDISVAVEELVNAGLVEQNPPIAADRLLARLKLAELRALDCAAAHAKRHKQALVHALVSNRTDLDLRTQVARNHSWLMVARTDALEWIKTFYFGSAGADFSADVMRDLGLVQFAPYTINSAFGPFESPDGITDYLAMRRLRSLLDGLEGAEQCWQLIMQPLWQPRSDRVVERRRNALLLSVARQLERAGRFDSALSCYGRCTAHPARERTVRLLKRLGDDESVTGILDAIAHSPRSAAERLFAARFRTPRKYTEVRRVPTTHWMLPCKTPQSVEGYVANALRTRAGFAVHTENAFSRGLAGILFWDVFFADVNGAFAHPYQNGPLDLLWDDFADVRALHIAESTAQLQKSGAVTKQLRRAPCSYGGMAHALVDWQLWQPGFINLVLQCIPERDLLAVAKLVLHNLAALRVGFPDLVVGYASGHYEFIEVKGPGDTLQPQQRIWLDHLLEAQLPVRVIHLCN